MRIPIALADIRLDELTSIESQNKLYTLYSKPPKSTNPNQSLIVYTEQYAVNGSFTVTVSYLDLAPVSLPQPVTVWLHSAIGSEATFASTSITVYPSAPLDITVPLTGEGIGLLYASLSSDPNSLLLEETTSNVLLFTNVEF